MADDQNTAGVSDPAAGVQPAGDPAAGVIHDSTAAQPAPESGAPAAAGDTTRTPHDQAGAVESITLHYRDGSTHTVHVPA